MSDDHAHEHDHGRHSHLSAAAPPRSVNRTKASQISPIFSGVMIAVAAAVAFGITIPVVGWAGAGVGPFTTAALLYLGASAAALAQQGVGRESGAPWSRGSIPPLLLMAVAGAAVAPALLAWGLQLTGPVTGGLLLNLEAVWTVVLARIAFGELWGRRLSAALGLMVLGGGLLAFRNGGAVGLHPLGAAAVAGAALAWAIDNTASRQLAELRPLTVVASKGALGAVMTTVLAVVLSERFPNPWQAVALLCAGATGYGASLRLYLIAQRKIGAARTASVFALAPFIGAGLGLVVDPAQANWATGAAALLFGAGVLLHVSERHLHQHRHDPVEHEHAHRHDDGHHTHQHSRPVTGEHSHVHQHDLLDHAHEHGPDVHHGHAH